MVQPSSEQREKPGSTTWILLAIVMVPQLGLTLVNPSNAAIAQDVGTQISTVEGTLTVYMVGYALSMFASGSLADRFHASRLQSAGLGLFTLGSVVAATAPSVAVLGIGRFLQALGGTSATVLCRIIVQRRFAAEARVDILTSMSMVISLTPSLSPLVGGFTAQVVPWRWLFVALAIFAAALIPTIEFLLGHAVPERPELPTLKQFIAANAQALGNKTFRWHAAAIALVWMTYFGFVSSSTTILQDFLGQSAVCYGMLMAIPAIGYLVGSLIIKRSQDIARGGHRRRCWGSGHYRGHRRRGDPAERPPACHRHRDVGDLPGSRRHHPVYAGRAAGTRSRLPRRVGRPVLLPPDGRRRGIFRRRRRPPPSVGAGVPGGSGGPAGRRHCDGGTPALGDVLKSRPKTPHHRIGRGSGQARGDGRSNLATTRRGELLYEHVACGELCADRNLRVRGGVPIGQTDCRVGDFGKTGIPQGVGGSGRQMGIGKHGNGVFQRCLPHPEWSVGAGVYGLEEFCHGCLVHLFLKVDH